MKLTALIALIMLNVTSRAQTATTAVINVAGNSSSQGQLSVDWSIGELALVNTAVSSTGTFVITNGFLQPEAPRANNSFHFATDEIKITPNLTNGLIEVHLLTRQQGTVKMRVLDVNGKLLGISKAVSNGVGSIEKFDLTRFAAGTYFLQIDLEPSLGSVRKSGSYKIVRL